MSVHQKPCGDSQSILYSPITIQSSGYQFTCQTNKECIFHKGKEEAALDDATAGNSELTAYFALCQTDKEANLYTYVQIPLHFIFNQKRYGNQEREEVTK